MIKIVEKNEYYCDVCKKQIHGPSDLIVIKTAPYEDRGDDGRQYTLTRHVCVSCFKKMPLFDFHLSPFERLIEDLHSAGLSHEYGYDERTPNETNIPYKRWIFYPVDNPKVVIYDNDTMLMRRKDETDKGSYSYKPITIRDAFNIIFTAWHNDYTDKIRKENENGTKE